jgi:hypothetical protein
VTLEQPKEISPIMAQEDKQRILRKEVTTKLSDFFGGGGKKCSLFHRKISFFILMIPLLIKGNNHNKMSYELH